MIILLKPIYNQILQYLREHPDSTEEMVRDYLVSINAEMEFTTESYLDDLEQLEFVQSNISWENDEPITYSAIENKRDKIGEFLW